MTRLSPNAERFYSAFYRWTYLNHHTSSCFRPRSICITQRTFHATRHAADGNGEVSSRVRYYDINSASREPDSRPPIRVRNSKPQPQAKAQEEPPLDDVLQRWQTAAVHTSSEKPFDELLPWDEVIRYRSSAGIMVLFALPADVVGKMQARWGDRFEKLRETTGARAEAGSSISKTMEGGERFEMNSILASGTHEDVARLRNLIMAHQPDSTTTSKHIPQAWLTGEPKTQAEISTTHLRAWGRPVVRERTRDGEVTVEWAVPVSEFDRITQVMKLEAIEKLSRISKVTVSKAFASAHQNGDGVHPVLYSLTWSGRPENVQGFRDRMLTWKQRGKQRHADPDVGNDVFRLRLLIPKHTLPGKDILNFVLGQDSTNLVNFQYITGAGVSRSKDHPRGIIVLEGGEQQIKHAKSLIQNKVAKVCARDEIGTLRASECEPMTRVKRLDLEYTGRSEMPTEGLTSSVDVDPTNFEDKRSRVPTEEFSSRTKVTPANVENTERPTTPTEDIKPTTKAEHVDAATAEHDEMLGEDFKLTLRTLTHSVVLITSQFKSDAGTEKGTLLARDISLQRSRGVTVSSFNTITMDPKPVVSFNLRVPSRTWDAIQSSGSVSVHFLAATPLGAAAAHAFTQPYDDPLEPFHRLERLGASFFLDRKRGSTFPPLRIRMPGAITARIDARVLPSNCVQVGDHIVAVAEVVKVEVGHKQARKDLTKAEEFVGLTYARRGYKGVGVHIEPVELPEMQIEEITDNMADTEDEPVAEGTDAGFTDNIAAGESTDVNDQSDQSSEDKGFDYFQAAADDVEAAESEDVTKQHAKQRTIDDEEAEDLRFEPEQDNTPIVESSGNDLEEKSHQGFEQPESSEPINQLLSPRSGDQQPPTERHNAPNSTRPKHGSQHAWGLEPRLKSSFSTYAFSSRRFYSTTMFRGIEPKHFDTYQPSYRSSDSPVSLVADPSLLTTSVGDFLGISNEPGPPPPRTRGIIRAKQEAERASYRLEQALADGTLTAEESARLEHVIMRNERRVAKKLAFQSARDLRLMLNQGRVDVRRVQWMESSVEKGQAVLLEEAKQLRSLLDNGAIREDRFKRIKAKMQQDHQILNTELLRLRHMVDEDSEADGAAYEQQPERTGRQSDEFRGDV